MKTVGKYLENEELEKVLKKTEGLGTLFIKCLCININLIFQGERL